jgi:hypothetical protein
MAEQYICIICDVKLHDYLLQIDGLCLECYEKAMEHKADYDAEVEE